MNTVHVSVLNSVALAVWTFISFHFELLDLHFFILAFWAAISCQDLDLGFCVGGSASSDRGAVNAGRQKKTMHVSALNSCHFGCLGLHFLSF